MKRKLFMLAMVLCLALTLALTACAPSYKLELYDADGKTLLQTITVKEGEAPKRPENPTKDGMTFDDWYITPTNQTKYDFSKPLTADAKAYARWKTAGYDDTRDWLLSGSMNSWGAEADGYHFTKSGSNGNVFTLTCDMELGDEFKMTVLNTNGVLDYNDTENGADVHYGLLKNPGENFSEGGGLGDAPRNIVCAKPGNYTFTLTTDPVNNNNSLSFVRNGDVVGGGEDEGPVTIFYLKGEKVTDWKDLIAETTTLAETTTEGQYKLEIYLPQDDKVMFASVVTENGTSTAGNKYIKYVNLDDAAKELFTDSNGNMQTNAAGKYTFVYDSSKSEKNLSVTVDTSATLPAADLYLDGDFDSELTAWNGYCFNAKYKLTKDAEKPWLYTIDNIALAADKQFIAQMFTVGATERGENNTNFLGTVQFRHMYNAGENFSAVSDKNNNIKILHESHYKITVNLLSKMITAEDLDIPDDACLHGLFEGASKWADGEKFTWDADAKTYTLTVALKANETFGIKILVGNTTAQRSWIGASAVTGTLPDGIGTSSGNFLVKTDGTYTFVVDMNGADPSVTVTAEPAVAE